MSETLNTTKRIVAAPCTMTGVSAGQVISVELGPDEDVKWIWSHDRVHGSTVTGYVIVTRESEPKQGLMPELLEEKKSC